MKRSIVVLCSVIILIGGASSVPAELFPGLNNPSFETAPAGVNVVKGTIDGWTVGGPNPSENVGSFNPGSVTPAPYTVSTPDGIRAAYINTDAFILQDLDATVEDGYRYTLTVAVGNRANYPNQAFDSPFPEKYLIDLRTGNNDILARYDGNGKPAEGEWADYTVSYDADGTFAGQTLRIVLSARQSTNTFLEYYEGNPDAFQINFDNVRIEKTAVPVPVSSFINEKTKVEYKLKMGEIEDKLELKWYVSPNSAIDPVAEDADFTVGDIKLSIPAGSFSQLKNEYVLTDTCTVFANLYTGTCDESKNKVKIKEENGYYKFEVKIDKCNLPEVGTVNLNPLHIELLIGNDKGEADLYLLEDHGKLEFKGEKP